jgi:hypothetical protein
VGDGSGDLGAGVRDAGRALVRDLRAADIAAEVHVV